MKSSEKIVSAVNIEQAIKEEFEIAPKIVKPKVIQYNCIYSMLYNGDLIKGLVLYNISSNHYVVVQIFDEEKTDSIYLKSIDKYILFNQVLDVARKEVNSAIYSKGSVLRINNRDRKIIINGLKKMFIKNISNLTNPFIPDDLNCLKWFNKELVLNKEQDHISELYRQRQVCWVDFGTNVGSELRKLRPAILWRSSKDKKIWTVIPLSTKCKQDNYYFHYDLNSVNDCSAKIESMMNFSYKRIVSPYYNKNVLAYINIDDYQNIRAIIKKYYTFS